MQCGDSCVSSDLACVQCGRHHPAHGHGGRAGHGAGDISAPALLRHKTSLITGTVIAKNYVLRITAVIIVSGEPIEVPSCGAEKICHRDRGDREQRPGAQHQHGADCERGERET